MATPTTEKVHIYDNQRKLIVNPGVARIGGRYPEQIRFFNNTSQTIVVKIPRGLAGGPVKAEIRAHSWSDAYAAGREDMAVVYTVTSGKRRGIGGSDPVIIIDT
jgi:hypothetical protein